MTGREDGSITPLVLGYVTLLAALIVLVIDVTAVQLARARLYDVADALALDASDAISQLALYRQGLGVTVPVTEETSRAAAQRLLETTRRPAYVSSWRLEPDTGVQTVGGRVGAVVTLTGHIDVPLGGELLGALGGVTVTVRSRAEALIHAPSAPGGSSEPRPPMRH